MSFASQVIKYKRYGRSDKEEEIFAATRGNGVFVLIAKQREWKRSEKYLMRFVRSGTPCLSTHADYLAGCHAILLCAHAHVSRTTWQIASVRESEQPARCGWYSRGCVYDKINELDSLSLSLSLSFSNALPSYTNLSFPLFLCFLAPLSTATTPVPTTFKVTDLGACPPYIPLRRRAKWGRTGENFLWVLSSPLHFKDQFAMRLAFLHITFVNVPDSV